MDLSKAASSNKHVMRDGPLFPLVHAKDNLGTVKPLGAGGILDGGSLDGAMRESRQEGTQSQKERKRTEPSPSKSDGPG
jgi:hypothetical protein